VTDLLPKEFNGLKYRVENGVLIIKCGKNVLKFNPSDLELPNPALVGDVQVAILRKTGFYVDTSDVVKIMNIIDKEFEEFEVIVDGTIKLRRKEEKKGLEKLFDDDKNDDFDLKRMFYEDRKVLEGTIR